MKKNLLFLFLGITMLSFSQVPSYYNDVNLNLNGTALKDELATKIINTHHTNLSYTPGVWDALKQTDLDPNNSANVVLIYGYDDSDGNYITDRTRSKDDNGGTAGSQWNREHVYPKSLGNPNLGTSGPGADAHHLRPADITFNSNRGSLKFASGSGNAGPSGGGWYPGDEWKGDVARMMMYMYLRYGNQCLPTGVGIGSSATSDANMINMFLQWNVDDPVSGFETQRNPLLETIQGNRNPFIDNPAFATQIWGGPQAEDKFGNPGGGDTEAPTVPTSLVASNVTQSSVDINWNAATDNTGVTAYLVYQNGTYIGSTANLTYSISGLTANTTYTFVVRARDTAGNQSGDSNSVSVTTLQGSGGGGTTTELLISEYVEGSSNNKALEIANFTGASVNLSAYSLKRNVNGGSSWGATYNLSGSLANGNTYVVANSSASSSVTSLADVTTGSDALSFNGNDPVGLFKNDVLIDIIGNFSGGSGDFAKDVTLRRKSSVTSPNTSYTTAEWDSFAMDTFGGLGTHSVDGGGASDTEAPSVPNGLSASGIGETSFVLNWNASTDNVGVSSYEIFQNGNSIGTTVNTSFNVSGLSASTSYNYTVTASDAVGNTSVASSALNVTTVDITAPSVPTGLSASNVTQTGADLNWNVATDNVGVSSYEVFQDGNSIGTTSGTSFSVSGLTANTSYTFVVRARDTAGNQSGDSNSVSVTTLQGSGGGGTTTELLISEYVEGSSNNKALEIANFTGASVNLSAYSLKRNVNGGSSWGGAYNLSGSLANGNTYVVANSSASSSVTSLADVTTGSDALSFNGNDPVGLFKNDVLIDIIGNFSGGSGDFAKDVTLRRKSSVTSPNTSYTTAEWDSFATDTFGGLGTHSVDGGGASDTEAPSVPNGLWASGIGETSFVLNWNASTDNVGVSSYEIFQNGNSIGTTVNTSFNVSGLSASTSYNYTVTASDAVGNTSVVSSALNVTTVDITAPSVPTGLSASNVTQTGADLNWNVATDNVGVSSYEVFQDGNSIGATSGTSFSVSGLTANTSYAFTVIAIDSAGNTSAASGVLNVSTQAAPGSPVVLHQAYFESGWDGWTDGGNDCSYYSGSRSYEGSSSIKLRDNSGTSSAMTSPVLDVSGFNTVEIEFYFDSYSMENNEDFWVRYYDGSSWSTVETYVSGLDFTNDGFYVATAVIDAATYTMSTNAQFRFQCDASSNADHIYIDQVTITGKYQSSSAKSGNREKLQFLRSYIGTESILSLYPNPVRTGLLYINGQEDKTPFTVYNLLGQTVLRGEVNNSSISVQTLKKGMYILELRMEDENISHKFIVE